MDGILTSYEKVDDQIIAGPTLSFRLQNEEVLGHCLDGKNVILLYNLLTLFINLFIAFRILFFFSTVYTFVARAFGLHYQCTRSPFL